MRTKKILACIIASLIVFLSLTPTYANAASSSEIRNQINELKKERETIQEKNCGGARVFCMPTV